jgi:hypothetical protein
MSKITGLGWTTLSVDTAAGSPVDIRNDITDFEFSTPREEQDVTGIDKSAKERLLLLADFSIEVNGVFNASTSHTVFKTVPSTDVARTVSLGIASQTLACETRFSDYQLKRSNSGEFTFTAPGALADGSVPTWS